MPFLAAAFLVAIFLVGCGASLEGDGPEVAERPVPGPAPSEATGFTLLGDPNFDAGELTDEQRRWHDRSLAGMNAKLPYILDRVAEDNIYHVARDVLQFGSALLLGLRSTGDLRYLDTLDEVTQAIRAELYDGWCGGVDDEVYVNAAYGTVHEDDGFRNLRQRESTGIHYCRDTGDLNETLAHGALAMFMYAFHVNRDLASPSGIDYAERADFWFDYLQNDFEAKWRSRSGVSWPEMDFIGTKFVHTYFVFSLYYYFMGKKLESDGDPDAAAYLDRVREMTEAAFEQPYEPGERAGGFVSVSAPTGDAVVYAFGAPMRGDVTGVHLEAAPMTYARYVLSAILMLRLEGFDRWDDAIMTRLANGLTGFVIDIPEVTSTSDTFAADVAGESVVGDIPPTTYRGRFALAKLQASTIPAMAIWDASGTIEDIARQAYGVWEWDEDQPDNLATAVSLLFVERARDDSGGLALAR